MLSRKVFALLLLVSYIPVLSAKGLVGLLVDPEKHVDKPITIAGYLGEFSEMTQDLYSIYLTKDDALTFNPFNSVVVLSKQESLKQCANTYVVIEGVVKRDSDFGYVMTEPRIVSAQRVLENESVELVFCKELKGP